MKLQILPESLKTLQNTTRRLSRFKTNGMATASLNAGNAVKSWIDDNFAQEGGLTPGGWQPLKSLTHVNGRMMQKSGRLRQNWLVSAENDGVAVKSGTSYALSHHLGTKALPARPLIPNSLTLAKLVIPIYAKAVTHDI